MLYLSLVFGYVFTKFFAKLFFGMVLKDFLTRLEPHSLSRMFVRIT